MKILRTYGGTEWCADPCAVLVDTNAVRLNEDLAERIRNDKRPDRVIAEELGVSREAVNHVKNGRTWNKGD